MSVTVESGDGKVSAANAFLEATFEVCDGKICLAGLLNRAHPAGSPSKLDTLWEMRLGRNRLTGERDR